MCSSTDHKRSLAVLVGGRKTALPIRLDDILGLFRGYARAGLKEQLLQALTAQDIARHLDENPAMERQVVGLLRRRKVPAEGTYNLLGHYARKPKGRMI